MAPLTTAMDDLNHATYMNIFCWGPKVTQVSHFNFSAILTCTEHREIEVIHQQPNPYIYRERQADTFKDSRDRCYQKDTSNSVATSTKETDY